MANIMKGLGRGSLNVKLIKVGTIVLQTPGGTNYSGSVKQTLDIKSKVKNYKELTSSNVIIGATQMYWDKSNATSQNATCNISYSYDYTTGIITVTGNHSMTNAYNRMKLTMDVYVIEGNVERI